jgi:hypothetical protein
MGGARSAHGTENKYKILEGCPAGKRPLGQSGRRLKNSNKIDLNVIEGSGLGSSVSGQERVRVLVDIVINFQVSSNAGNLFTS